MYMLNVNMSINIISMVKPITSNLEFNDLSSIEDSEDNFVPNVCHSNMWNVTMWNHTLNLQHGPRYSWSHYEQSLILGAHSYGSLFPNLIGGAMAERFGARNLIVLTFSLSAVITCLAPVAASNNFIPIFIIRLCIGFLSVSESKKIHLNS